MPTYKTSKAKENILRKIRLSLQEAAVPIPFPEAERTRPDSYFAASPGESPEETFALEFSRSGGYFVFCDTEDDLLENLKLLAESRGWNEVFCTSKPLFSFLVDRKVNFVREFNPLHQQAQACITECEAAVARTGSLLLSSRQHHGRVAPVYFPVHIAIVYPGQVVPDIADAFELLKTKYKDQLPSMFNLNTGPSRTADIEKTLVTGVHGPKEVFCFFLNR